MAGANLTPSPFNPQFEEAHTVIDNEDENLDEKWPDFEAIDVEEMDVEELDEVDDILNGALKGTA